MIRSHRSLKSALELSEGPDSTSIKAIDLYLSGQSISRPMSTQLLQMPTGRQLSIPVVDNSFAADILKQRYELSHLKIGEILAFINNAGQNWKRPDYIQRTRYERNLRNYLGYSAEAARNEANWIALLLCSTHRLYDVLSCELGAWQMVDGWVHREEAMVTASPRGTVLHLLPGNVPLSCIVSLLRGLITKNASILKVSSADPFTANALLASFLEIDPSHPIPRSISIAYWQPETDGVAEQIAAGVDAIVAWGGDDAVAWARRRCSPRAEVIAFGPRHSFTIIGPGADLAKAARGAAFDSALYDQRACFSTREIFVHASIADSFENEFVAAQADLDRILPPSDAGMDEMANRTLSRKHEEFLGAKLSPSASGSCTIVGAPRCSRLEHCLGRTVYLTVFDDIAEVLAEVDSTVQTVGIAPREYAEAIRDRLVYAGITRLVEPGLHNVFRPGGSHDAMYPLQRLVRFVSHEASSDQLTKGINIRIDQTEFVEHDRFLEFIP